jgi:hypothetical protein
MFVVDKPFPSGHCVCDVPLLSFFEHGLYLLFVGLELEPDLFECHEDGSLELFEIDPCTLLTDQIPSFFNLFLHIALIPIEMLKPQLYFAELHLEDVDLPQMHSLHQLPFSLSIQDVE